MQGTVKWFNKDKGYGFISGDDNREYFVHFREIDMPGYKCLQDGQRVDYTVGTTPKGVCAQKVRVSEDGGNR